MVTNYLSSPEVDLNSDQDAIIEFYINDNNRIAITDVQTEDAVLKHTIKSRLNLEKVTKDMHRTQDEFRIKLRFTNKLN